MTVDTDDKSKTLSRQGNGQTCVVKSVQDFVLSTMRGIRLEKS